MKQLLSAAILCLLLIASPAFADRPLSVGLYIGGVTDSGQSAGVGTIVDVNNWIAPTGQQARVDGTFFDMVGSPANQAAAAQAVADAISHGYAPWLALMSSASTSQIANGAVDNQLRSFAAGVAGQLPPGQRIYLSVLPEMNGRWETYYGLEYTGGAAERQYWFKKAFAHVRSVFEEFLSQADPIWVFAPNGWSEAGDEFEKYYPDPNLVDHISVSGYNYGTCPSWGGTWQTFDVALRPYLDRLHAMAPNTPLWADTGTLAQGEEGAPDKNAWLRELYARMADYPYGRGVIYFNVLDRDVTTTLGNCPWPADYRVHVPGTSQWPGFYDAMGQLTAANTTFVDVPTNHPFFGYINAVVRAGTVSGCAATNPPQYCPDSSVIRSYMAVFLLRGIHGAGYNPPLATGTFADVPTSHPFAKWIEQLAREGITSGCGGGNYCPDATATRGQMAVFLVRTFNLPM